VEEVEAEKSSNTIVVDPRSLLSEEDNETMCYLLATEGRKNELAKDEGDKRKQKSKQQLPKSPNPKIKLTFTTPKKASRAERRRSDTPTELPSPVPGTFHCKGTI
jgi:hypothetical protein